MPPQLTVSLHPMAAPSLFFLFSFPTTTLLPKSVSLSPSPLSVHPSCSISSSPSSSSNHVSRRRRRRRRLPLPLRVAAPSSPTAPSPTSDEEALGIEETSSSSSSSPSSPEESFSWRDHWYPVSLVEDLDPYFPTPFQLLNRDLVLWKDARSGDWVAFDDLCPHRLAPLSEGRIDEDGCLQCSYHGWSFDRTGSCVRIPQAAADGPEARAVRSPRACVAKFPTLVSQGLLFVWPDENGWEKAAATKPPM